MTEGAIRVLVLGASGMMGSAALRLYAQSQRIEVVGTVRSAEAFKPFPHTLHTHLIPGIDAQNIDSIVRAVGLAAPDVVLNCIGLVKQLADANAAVPSISLNALFPHRLAQVCQLARARLVHLSTDCVFSGAKGMYTERDTADATDMYGRTKFLGEVDYENAITLRTSIIGHEMSGSKSLLEWFLAQEGNVRGFTHATFSGLPTVELAALIRDRILPRPDLRGVYHVAGPPITKYELLRLIRQIYGKRVKLEPCDELVIDRSLDGSRFQAATGFVPKPWDEMIQRMHEFG